MMMNNLTYYHSVQSCDISVKCLHTFYSILVIQFSIKEQADKFNHLNEADATNANASKQGR